MALVFRWYLGMSSHWANTGEPSRTVDYQIWCGPAMAAFNDWVRGSFLEQPENRRVATVALNILYGAAVLTRARIASVQGLALPAGRAPADAPGARPRLRTGCSYPNIARFIGEPPATATTAAHATGLQRRSKG